MPDSGSSIPHRSLEGAAVRSRLASSVPALVVPDHVLAVTAGPVPVEIRFDGRRTQAWAWAERAWGDTGHAFPVPPPVASADSTTFWLSRLAVERLDLADLTDTGTCLVSVLIPDPVALRPVLPLVHDLPGNREVQVPHDVAHVARPQVMVRNGVAAWVTLIPRGHVRPGTVRISNHLRAITEPPRAAVDGDGDGDGDAVFFRPLTEPSGRVRGRRMIGAFRARLRWASERCLRWFFLAPEQSMRVARAHPDDEHQHMVTMHDVALSRLGVRSGDNVILRWGSVEIEVSAVSDHNPGEPDPEDSRHDPTKPGPARGMPPHLAVRVPTVLRHMIDLPAASVVTVRRSTRSVLARNLNGLVIPVASLALAGAALNDPNWALLICGAVATAVLALSRLRMGSRRALRLKH